MRIIRWENGRRERVYDHYGGWRKLQMAEQGSRMVMDWGVDHSANVPLHAFWDY